MQRVRGMLNRSPTQKLRNSAATAKPPHPTALGEADSPSSSPDGMRAGAGGASGKEEEEEDEEEDNHLAPVQA